ncbi:MAG: hypothetical protein K0S01_1857 [Herbinix sp.]|nr:hypothetical protein [Herbinix sp.]
MGISDNKSTEEKPTYSVGLKGRINSVKNLYEFYLLASLLQIMCLIGLLYIQIVSKMLKNCEKNMEKGRIQNISIT